MKGPVFVVGPMRSGTTLLRLMLDAHPDLAIPEETGFMAGGSAVLRIPGWQYGDVWYERVGWQRHELVGELRAFYQALFGRYAATQGANRWGDKTPLHVFHLEALAEVFPDARFIGIVRHPAAVVSSMVTKWRREPGAAASYWQRASTELVRAGRLLGDERFVLIRYEDLVFDPERVMRDVCASAELTWTDAVLRHGEVQRDKGAPPRTDGATSTTEPVDASLASSWKNVVTAPMLQAVERETGELARWLGYELDEAAPDPWVEGGRRTWSLSASALDHRAQEPGAPAFRRQTEDVLDLDADADALAKRAALAERALANIRRRRSVRAVDAFRRAQREGLVATVARLRRSGRASGGGSTHTVR